MRYVLVVLMTLLAVGCSSAPALRPVEARAQVLQDPAVAAWYARHSAPAVLSEMTRLDARRWPRYQPAIMFDQDKDGYLVKLDAKFGPAPRRLEARVDRTTGAVLSLRERR